MKYKIDDIKSCKLMLNDYMEFIKKHPDMRLGQYYIGFHKKRIVWPELFYETNMVKSMQLILDDVENATDC